MSLPPILFVDAATFSGYAVGIPGSIPKSGSQYFAKSGARASRNAVFSGAIRFTLDMIEEYGKDLIIGIEAPVDTSFFQGKNGKRFTNIETTQVLMGVIACIRGAAYTMGVHDAETHGVQTIRKHFIGRGNLGGKEAKPMTHRQCRELGWILESDADQTFDRSDALAGWSYLETKFFPSFATPVGSLFPAPRSAPRKPRARKAS